MELNFDFNTLEKPEEFVSKYFEPGNYLLTFNTIEVGTNSSKGTNYIEVVLTDKETQTKECKQRYQLAGGALKISAAKFVEMVAAVNNIDNKTDDGHNKAKSLIGNIADAQQLVNKLSSLLIGKTAAVRLTGEWVAPTEAEKSSYIRTLFNQFAPVSKLNTLKPFDPTNKYDLKGTKVEGTKATTETKKSVDSWS